MRNTIVLDIETTAEPESLALKALAENLAPRGNLTDPAKIQRDLVQKRADLLEDAALSPWTGSVVAIGYHVMDEGVSRCFAADQGEAALLEDFAETWASWHHDYMEGAELVTFCGRRFDVPFLAARLAVHGIGTPVQLPVRRPHCFGYHLDLKEDLMKDFKGGLNIAALRLLGRGKVDDLEQLQEWIKQGNWEGVRAYCLNDVELTKAIYERYRRLL